MKLQLTKLNEVDREDKDIDELVKFVKFVAKKLGIKGDMKITLVGKNSGDQGMSTGGFDVYNNQILAREYGRSLVDIMRSIAHELVHYKQKEAGKFKPGDNIPNIGGEIEDEANALCGQLVKMYVDEEDSRWLYTY
jgi:hypothetical protein